MPRHEGSNPRAGPTPPFLTIAEAATLRDQIAGLQTDLAAAQATADRHYAALQQAEGVRDAALEAANRADAEAQAARDRLADMERDNEARRAIGRWARLRNAWRE